MPQCSVMLKLIAENQALKDTLRATAQTLRDTSDIAEAQLEKVGPLLQVILEEINRVT